jgi:hypothetical protein
VSARSIAYWSALLLALMAGAAGACQICIPLPERTLADRLLASDAVVLAREDAERPFHYRVTEVLSGTPNDSAIDLFLNSQARRTLAADSDRAMVLARSGKDGTWSQLGLTRPAYERVVREILSRADRWRPRETDNAERLDWFVPLLGHADHRLHELAYLEIGRAPYVEIRRLARHIPVETLQAMLVEPRYLEWRNLAILMLGESHRQADRARVRDALSQKARFGSSLNLAAWATALLAVDGEDGLRRLQMLYLSDDRREREELEAVIQAVSVYTAAEPMLRDQAAELYRRMLERHPNRAPQLVHDLIAWKRWDFVAPLQQARAGLRDDPLAAYALGLYLRLAGERSDRLPTAPASDPTPAPQNLDPFARKETR